MYDQNLYKDIIAGKEYLLELIEKSKDKNKIVHDRLVTIVESMDLVIQNEIDYEIYVEFLNMRLNEYTKKYHEWKIFGGKCIEKIDEYKKTITEQDFLINTHKLKQLEEFSR